MDGRLDYLPSNLIHIHLPHIILILYQNTSFSPCILSFALNQLFLNNFVISTSPSIPNSVIESNQCPGTLYSYQYIMQDQLCHLRNTNETPSHRLYHERGRLYPDVV